MSRLLWTVSIVSCVAACGGKKDEPPAPVAGSASAAGSAGSAATKLEGPIRAAFGDCTGFTDAAPMFVSGPRPTRPTTKSAAAPAPRPPGADLDAQIEDVLRTGKSIAVPANRSRGGRAGGDLDIAGIGGARRQPMLPTVGLGTPIVQGELAVEVVNRYLRRNQARYRYCYEKQLQTKPDLEGKVELAFVIADTGTVSTATATGMDPEVTNCIATATRALPFPKPTAGEVKVKVAMKLHMPGGSTQLPGATLRPRIPTPTKPPKLDPVKPPTTAKPADEAEPQAIAQLPGRTGNPTGPYTAGADNPMREKGDLFIECFRLQPKRHGVMVVDFTFDATGAVTDAIAHGIDSEAVKSCVATAAKQVRREASPAGQARCGVAFGTMGVDELPGLDVGPTAIRLDGEELGTIAEATDASKLGRLRDALALRDKVIAAPRVPVSIVGPFALRITDDTPMRAVDAIAEYFDRDALHFAMRAGSEWKLLQPLDAPVAPIPVRTDHAMGEIAPRTKDVAEVSPVVVSILVDADAIYIASTKGNGSKLPGDAWSALGAELAKWQADAEFAGSGIVEIAGGGTATYGNFVKAVQTATSAGITNWQFARESLLTTKARR